MLTTFNLVGYINERELNKSCGVSSICNSLHIELHLTGNIVCFTLPCHDSLNRTCIILDCASCHVYACAFTMLFVSFRCCFLVPVMLRLWGFVRLRPFIFFMDLFFFVAGFQARWPYPRNHFYLCCASCFVLSLCCATYHLLFKPPKLPWTSNLCHPS